MAPHISEHLESARGFSLAQNTAPASFNGRTLLDLHLRKRYSVNLIDLRQRDVADESDGKLARQIINVPLPETVIDESDSLWCVGSEEDLVVLPHK